MEWKAQDAELVRTRGNSLAGLTLGLPPPEAAPQPAAGAPQGMSALFCLWVAILLGFAWDCVRNGAARAWCLAFYVFGLG